MKKPLTKEDIIPEFKRIGEPGWAEYIRSLFQSYEIPLPDLATEKSFEKILRLTKYKLPEEYILFHTEIGPIFELLDIKYVQPAKKNFWFYDQLSNKEQALLDHSILIGTGGSDNFFSLDLATGKCLYLCHDPLEIIEAFNSFHEFVRWIVLGTHISEYGWPDDYIMNLVIEAQNEIWGQTV